MLKIKEELIKVQEAYKREFNIDISEEKAFTALVSHLYFFSESDFKQNIYSINDSITDMTSDGGIDIVYFDDEQMKVILVQTKYTDSVSNQLVISELNKIHSTVRNFEEANYSSYNKKLKSKMINALNSLNEEDKGNVEYWFVTTSTLDETQVFKKIENDIREYHRDMVVIKQKSDLVNRIYQIRDESTFVKFDKIDFDKTSGILKYEGNEYKGIVVNVSSKSIKDLYNAHQDSGLFDLNIRRYVANKAIDTGIQKTIGETPDEFWFLNNGITIACKYFEVDGNKIKLNNFSIVNGGQTTKIIGDSKNTKVPFYLTCKIISNSNENEIDDGFYTKVAEATNSQKPILPRDIKANRREMRVLKNWLKEEHIHLEIKRGEKSIKTYYKIKNDELGQLILSFVNQKPGTARSGKKLIFDNNSLYNSVFNVNYEKPPYRNFLIDLIDLNRRISILTDDLLKDKASFQISVETKNILKNGKQIIVALFGVLYRLTHDEVFSKKLSSNLYKLQDEEFVYGTILSNYKEDDLDDHILQLINFCLQTMEEAWSKVQDTESSISNFFKTDKKYIELIVKYLAINYSSKFSRARIEESLKIFI